MLLLFYQVFPLAHEEVELYSSIFEDRQPFEQSINHLQQRSTLITVGQDTHHLHHNV